MKNLLYLATFVSICFYPLITKSQTLGGYTIYGYLATATHPDGCNSMYVTNIPDDSIWVNFDPGDVLTGNFSIQSQDQTGSDLLLETGFNFANYTVSLLLSSGIYSVDHNVTTASWTTLPQSMHWQYMGLTCYTGAQTDFHCIVPLDFITDFGLTPTDTVVGIKIIFLTASGATDFAGAYIVSPQTIGLNEEYSKPQIHFYPNPFSDYINITSTSHNTLEFKMYDISSRRILHQEFIGSATLNTSQFAKGIYIYEIRDNNKIIKQGKIVKHQ